MGGAGGGVHRRGNYIHISTHGDNNCEAVFACMWASELGVFFLSLKCFVISCSFSSRDYECLEE